MMDAEPGIEELLHLFVARCTNVPSEELELRVILATELVQPTLSLGSLLERERRLDRFFPCMHEHHHLVALMYKFGYFLEGDLV